MAIHEIRVTPLGEDPLGNDVRQEAKRTLGIDQLDAVRTTKVYRVEGVSDDDAKRLAGKLFADPVSEKFTIDAPLDFDAAQKVEVDYKPGVMNPEVESILKAAHDMGISAVAAGSSREYNFVGQTSEQEVEKIVGRLLVNKTVQQVVERKPETLVFEGSVGPVDVIPMRQMSLDELRGLSKDKLFLDDSEMLVQQRYWAKKGRDPRDIELEIPAAKWSEHCGHKTFDAIVVVDGVEKSPLFRRIKDTAREYFGDKVISAFGDNSGVMRFYDGLAICGKVETHNSPSAVEPYGGAMTGTGGVVRDIMGTGQGAKTIISTDMFCFAPPSLDESLLPPGTLNPDYLQRRVIHGVRDYGNRMGIPTANGSIHYHEDFRAKPTVIVGAYGIMPEKYAQKGVPQIGDLVVAIGGRTGRDGIHGATFSSGEMTDRTANVNSSAVQIGNPIEEKRMTDALIEARDTELIRAITDCGAAGFSSAIGEMGEDIGVTVDISKAPLKYPGLAPWEIWLSESQERMVAAIAPEKIEEFLKILQKHNVEVSVLGEFDGSHTLTINYGQQNVAELDYEFLSEGLPQRRMNAHWERQLVAETVPAAPQSSQQWVDTIKGVLSQGNVCSKEPVVRQYDHGVQGGNIVSPFGGVNQDGPNDALVIRPVLGKPYGMVQSHGMNPILNRIDPYEGSVWATAEAMANYVAVGGDPKEAVLINNYIWPFPDEEAMGSLDRSVDAVCDMMHVLKTPVVSGKDSLSSTYRGKDGLVIKIPPVLCMSAFGRIPDVEKTITSDIKRPELMAGEVKKPGSVLVFVGKQGKGLAGSAYLDVVGGSSNQLPIVDTEVLPAVLEAVHSAIKTGNVLSCHDVSEGGVITAVSEMCIGGNCGVDLAPSGIFYEDNLRDFLFDETAGCFVVEVPSIAEADRLFKNVPNTFLGYTTSDKTVKVALDHHDILPPVFAVGTDELKTAWQAPIKGIFH